ncbi:hypothetical protein HanRHA438_Chr04g0187341 [Helianthus annuus]|nr:hypothetical protein HanRHA438_Chr04g0187341 [Helianthus annuus]
MSRSVIGGRLSGKTLRQNLSVLTGFKKLLDENFTVNRPGNGNLVLLCIYNRFINT